MAGAGWTTLLGGLGIFFVGITLVSSNLRKMTSRRLRLVFYRFTNTDLRGALLGLGSGLVTQSPSVAAFITAGLVSSGLMRVRKALPVVFWANAGSCVLVLIAVLDVTVLVDVLLFFAGVSVAFERPRSMRHLAMTLFGVGLLFTGLSLIRQGAMPLAQMDWVRSVLHATTGHYFLALLTGMVLTAVTQTTLGIILIGLALAKGGLFGVPETIMLVYGAHLGSSLTTWFLALSVRGRPKQLIMAQVLMNVIGALIMVPLFYVEFLGGVPLVHSLVAHLTSDMERQMAFIVIIFNWGVTFACFPFHDQLAALLARWWPQTRQEDLSRLHFLADLADLTADAPDAVMSLGMREMGRLVVRFPEYVQAGAEGEAAALDARHAAYASVGGEVRATLDELAGRDLGPGTAQDLVLLRGLVAQVDALEEGVNDLARLFGPGGPERPPTTSGEEFYGVLRESAHFFLLTLAEAWNDAGRTEARQLYLLTRDRGETLERFRRRCVELSEGVDVEEKTRMHRAGILFERVVWLVNRVAALLMEREIGTDEVNPDEMGEAGEGGLAPTAGRATA
ncbi:MAG: Na/Pi cotransporter family protein [Desulfovibrionaceae bacterium]|nr:Na/Pi cotransporter family protein [Desulfovibrionaceae bacterium]